jgi:hypothetical protein
LIQKNAKGDFPLGGLQVAGEGGHAREGAGFALQVEGAQAVLEGAALPGDRQGLAEIWVRGFGLQQLGEGPRGDAVLAG